MGDRITGVMAAGLTAFNDDLSIDVAGTLAHTKWLLANGCDGVLLFGTTGEANSLSMKERLSFLDALGTSGLPMDKLMIGTGCCSVADTGSDPTTCGFICIISLRCPRSHSATR